MDKLKITDLEAELGCLELQPSQASLRKDHGDSNDFFDIPAEATTCLKSASRTKSFNPFGKDGTIGWTTHAGELFAAATCLNNRLIGAAFRKCIEQGLQWSEQEKMIERAINSPQGSGYGIGIAIKGNIQPSKMVWVYNRWPRYQFKSGCLDIRLQYYIHCQSIIQQYQIRNNSNEEADFPYMISSDICFRDHDAKRGPEPISVGRSKNRLILCQNSEVVVKNSSETTEMRMAVFLTGQRIPLGTVNPCNDGHEINLTGDLQDTDAELRKVEERLQDSILNKGHLSPRHEYEYRSMYTTYCNRNAGLEQWRALNKHNYAEHQANFQIPGNSTQELCGILQLSHLTSPNIEPIEIPTEQPRSHDEYKQKRDLATGSNTDLVHEAKCSFPSASDQTYLKQVHSSSLLTDLSFGETLVRRAELGQARYYLYKATLTAESLLTKEDLFLSKIRFRYAEFLAENGWFSAALTKLKDLFEDLSARNFGSGDVLDLWMKVLKLFGSMYLDRGNLSEAEALYERALAHCHEVEIDHKPVAIQCLEKLSWIQVCQGKNEEADKNYVRLLGQTSSHRRSLLCNRGFVQRRLGRLQEAVSLFEMALKEECNGLSETSKEFRLVSDADFTRFLGELAKSWEDVPHRADVLYPLSGLYNCQIGLAESPQNSPGSLAFAICYVNVNTALCSMPYRTFALNDDPIHFAMARHLESLLSCCSVPVQAQDCDRGIAFINPSPIHSIHVGRLAYFQFRLLVQSLGYLNDTQDNKELKDEMAIRIRRACDGHLVWVSKIAQSVPTWCTFYSIAGVNVGESLDSSTRSCAVEGAFNILKLYCYVKQWKDGWTLVLDLLHLKMKHWLFYLVKTQHMGNLWIEDEGMESFRLDTTPGHGGWRSKMYPRYHLSDAALIWQALLHLEKLIHMVESAYAAQPHEQQQAADNKVRIIQDCYQSFKDTLDLATIQSNIMNSFKVPIRTHNAPTTTNEPPGSDRSMTAPRELQPTFSYTRNNPSLLSERSVLNRRVSQTSAVRQQDRQVIIFVRTVREHVFEIQPNDVAIFEASTQGLFGQSKGQHQEAWCQTLKMQKDRLDASLQEPQLMALSLFASHFEHSLSSCIGRVGRVQTLLKRLTCAIYDSGFFAGAIQGDVAAPISDGTPVKYETMSLLIGSLYSECRQNLPLDESQGQLRTSYDAFRVLMDRPRPSTPIPVLMPAPTDPSSNVDSIHNVDAAFLPHWMYHYPDFIHTKWPNINIEEEIKQLDSTHSFQRVIAEWKENKTFWVWGNWRLPVTPTVCDLGVKQRSHDNHTKNIPDFDIESFYIRDDFWKRLIEPQSPKTAKPRLIEMSSLDKASILICWLATPNEEKPIFMWFFRRHERSYNSFAERAQRQGNVWATELHINFYQLVQRGHENESEDKEPTEEQPFGQKVPGLPNSLLGQEVLPVALSFRFFGDFRDRLWTCHFLSSASEGFTGLLDEDHFSTSMRSLGFDPGHQIPRKLVELMYVEQILIQVRESTEQILEAFEEELDETLSPRSESLDFIHDHASRPLQAKNLISAVLERLDSVINTMAGWERREESKGVQDIWLSEDQQFYGESLKHLMLRCKSGVQDLLVSQSSLREQLRAAGQRHTDLVSYKQLQEAQRSTRSAADVRLFTYVTIIFLPLSFTSSLFSMVGKPSDATIAVMAPTAVVALTITFLLLSNMKALHRNWSFWIHKLNRYTRERMISEEYGKKWGKTSEELEETTQRRLHKEGAEEHLMAETKWYYLVFWLFYLLDLPRSCVRSGVSAWTSHDMMSIERIIRIIIAALLAPPCLCIFIIHLLAVQTFDTAHLCYMLASWLVNTMLSPLHSSSTADSAMSWLASPPRPLRGKIQELEAKRAPESSQDRDDESEQDSESSEDSDEEDQLREQPNADTQVKLKPKSLVARLWGKRKPSPHLTQSTEQRTENIGEAILDNDRIV